MIKNDDLEIQAQTKAWMESRKYTPRKLAFAKLALQDVQNGVPVFDAIKKHPLQKQDGGGYISKHMMIVVYRQLVESGEIPDSPALLAQIRMKPMRTLSGVTVVTVLTKPYPCPGDCIFCPTDVKMPKSYLPDEPGAMRALHHNFDPYTQVKARLIALEAVGHPTEKIELLILGGTWSFYKEEYQEWFITECFRALNERDFETFEEAQIFNETSKHRNVGLVIETRPDHITIESIAWLRHLGVTKVQMGAQSMDDEILEQNHRGHTVKETIDAVRILRAGGFKIVLHWMPNLYGADIQHDIKDFSHLWEDVCPDELKIYPTQLLKNTALYSIWKKGLYKPYTTNELLDLLATIKPTIPRYCRINRVIRDIPSTHVVEGNKRTSLRMDLKKEMDARGQHCDCIRCREVRKQKVDVENLKIEDVVYQAGFAEEHFLTFVTPNDKLAGFLRLSFPKPTSPDMHIEDLKNAAIIREVHVYGQSLEVGSEQNGAAQHIGLGSQLIEHACSLAKQHGYPKMAVIAAIGTRKYYAGRKFKNGSHYMVRNL